MTGDLEDAFLKQNVPGQYSKWSIDNDRDQHSSDDSEDDEYYFADAPCLPLSTSTAAPSAAALKKGGNTGVKGVISDYLDTKRKEELKAATDRLEELEILNATVNPATREMTATEKVTRRQDDNDSEDEEFLQKFRSERLRQLNNISRRTFGTYDTVTPDEYVTLVDTTDPQSFVVVHLYESSIKESLMLHSALQKVAQLMDHVKFIEVEAYEAKPDLDMICLPALLVYKEGELVANALRFTDGLVGERGGGECLDVEDVMEALVNLGVESKRG